MCKKLRPVLFPTETEQKRAWHLEEERQERYKKYIPRFMPKTYATIASWFPLCMFIYFMTFGISIAEHKEQISDKTEKKYQEVLDKTNDVFIAYKAANEYRETHPITNDNQMLWVWNSVMKPLHLDNNTNLNWLILLGGTIIGLGPTLILAHRKKIVDNMYNCKFNKINVYDKIDKKIIYNMSKDSSSYFYHMAFNSVCDEQMKKLKKIAIPIIKGHLKSHPEDLKKALATKIYKQKTKNR